jgi:alpha-tubulin suppressor-like RCC1 family protein
VAANASATCALLVSGQIECWGDNTHGQLGLGDTQPRFAPPARVVDLGSGRSASALSLGDGFACALLDTHQAKCWGDNSANQLGAALHGPAYGDDPNEMGDFLPVAVQGGGRRVRAIAAGRAHACAILDTGDARCWGDNTLGQLAAGDASAHSLFFNSTGAVDLGAAK